MNEHLARAMTPCKQPFQTQTHLQRAEVKPLKLLISEQFKVDLL